MSEFDLMWRHIMKHMNAKSLLYLLIFFGLASESLANSWTCRNAELTRNLLIFYPDAPARLPCKVYYTKPMENIMPRALWKAENEENYCHRKAKEFIGKLKSWGWRCSRDSL